MEVSERSYSRRQKLALFILALAPILLNSAYPQSQTYPIVELGLPHIQSFSSEDYPGGSQNWAVTQDQQGIIYVGNVNNTVMQFDGVTWRPIRIPNTTTVRSLAVSHNNRIYVGAVGEIGYLQPDENGTTVYVSLLDQLSDDQRGFADVWRTYTRGDSVYFSTFLKVFRYSKDGFKMWTSDSSFHSTFAVRDQFFIRERGTGLLELRDDKLSLVPGGEIFADERIYAMVAFNDHKNSKKVVIGTRSSGWFIFDGTGITPWKIPAEKVINDSWIYTAKLLPNNTIAVGTLQNGLYILDVKGQLLRHINKDSGLPDNAILDLHVDQQGGLWCTFGSGIARIDINSPITRFDASSGLKGLPLSIRRFNKQLYVGASNGLYRMTSNSNQLPEFEKLETIKGQVWSLRIWGDSTLLLGTEQGVYAFDGSHAQLLRKSQQVSLSLSQSRANPNRVWIGMQDGLASIRWENGRWLDEGKSLSTTAEVRQVVETAGGVLWLGTNGANALHVTVPKNWTPGDQLSAYQYGIEHGLSKDRRSYVYNINGDVLFTTDKGILFFDPTSSRFKNAPQFSSIFSYNAGHKNPLLLNSDGSLWVLASDPSQQYSQLGLATPTESGRYNWASTAFKPLNDVTLADAIYQDEDGIAWFGGDKKLYRYDPKVPKNYHQNFTTLLRRVSKRAINETIYAGAGDYLQQRIEYQHNALRFEYSSTNLEYINDNQFQVKLIGVDREWSQWSTEAYRDYSSIPAGNYKIAIRAKNIYGTIAEAAPFTFRILAPWYQTKKMLFAYIALLSFIIWVGIQWRSRILLHRNRILAQLVEQKTRELAVINAELTEQSLTDTLTGLKNRRFLRDKIYEDVAAVNRHYENIEQGQETYLTKNPDLLFVVIDLDHFKQVNDDYGHAVGDMILKQIGAVLFSATRETDTPIRWGGEEFLVVARQVDPLYVTQLPERIRSAVEQHTFDIGEGRFLHKTCSIGFASFPLFQSYPKGVGWEQVIDIADQCLYVAKNSGRNTWVGVRSSDKMPDFEQGRLRKNVKELVDEGYLSLSSSIGDPTKLTWN